MSPVAGSRSTTHWRVGRKHRVLSVSPSFDEPVFGVCVSVTYWGNDQVRWVRLRHDDGQQVAYPPSWLRVVD